MSTETGEVQATRLQAAADQLTALLRRPEVAARLGAAPSESDWSALQILGHIIEMIPYWLDHCERLIAATGEPPRFGRTLDAPERLAGVAQGTAGNAEGMLRQLNDEVQAAVSTIRNMSPAERAKTGVHNRFGLMTVADAIQQFIVDHAEEHLAQVRAALSK